MAYEFEKLSEVEAIEEFPEEGASVLIEHEGSIKRCPADGLGGGGGGKIPVLLVNIDYDAEEYIFELEDGRTADEFVASFEKDGITPAILMVEPSDEAGEGVIAKQYFHMSLYMEERMTEGVPSEYASLVGGCTYMYVGNGAQITLTNIDTREMVLLDHYIWAPGGL